MDNKNILDIYLKDIKNIPRISEENEIEFSKIIQHSTNEEEVEKATKEMIEGNLRLVVKYAFQYHRKYITSLSEMDLIEEGNVGLVKAAYGYKSETGNRFSTYAVRCICSHLNRAIQNGRFIHVPGNHFKYLNRLKALMEEQGESITDEILMKELGVSKYMLKVLKIDLQNQMVELDDNVQLQLTVHTDQESPFKNIEIVELREELMGFIEELSPLEKEIIISRHFSDDVITYKEIASKHGFTRQRIEQIYKEALKKLQSLMKNKNKK